MERTRHPQLAVAIVLALAGTARAQGTDPLAEPRAPLPRWTEAWMEARTPATGPGASATEPTRRPSLLTWGLGDPHAGLSAADEELIALVSKEPPPITREELDRAGAPPLRYHGLPGGIVLGRVARAPAELAGARLAGSVEQGLALHLADGRVVAAPEIAPEALRACLAFAAQPFDALVHLVPVDHVAPRLAPAFAGSALEPLLVRMDQLPHGRLPATRAWKSLIVDRAARCTLRGTELVLTADLEVRFYADAGDSGRAVHAHTVEALAADFVGPRAELDLAGELAPLSELAGWLGFLRLAAELDPRGFAALCSR